MAGWKDIQQMFFAGEWSKLRSWELGPLIAYHVVYFAVRGLIKNRGTVLTASLAFTTALAVVPLLSVALWVLLKFGNLDDGASLVPYIQQLFPAAASGIVTYLNEFAKTSANEVAGIGALTFYAVAFLLFVAIERAFNIIWASHRRRPLTQKVGAFLATMTFGPLLLSFSFGLSTYAEVRAEQFNIDFGLGWILLPFVLGFAIFWGMNHFLPTTKVQPWASALAAAFTALVFEIGKVGFNLYVTELILVPYNQVYGALGLLPLFLIWLYVIWIIVLFGAELAYVSQNLRTLVRVERAAKRGFSDDHIFSPTIGLELYAPIAIAFKTGEGRLSDRELVAISGYPEAVVRTAVEELARIGALEIVDEDEGDRRLLPAKQLEDIELWPMLDAFFDFAPRTEASPVKELMRRYKTVSLDVLTGQSALAFIPEGLVTTAAPTTSNLMQEPERAAPPHAATPVPSREPEPVSFVDQAPDVDADLFDSPLSHLAEGATLDAHKQPLQRARALADRAKSLSNGQEREFTEAAARPMAALALAVPDEPTAVEASDDGIRIHTQDILVEEEELAAPAKAGKSASALLRNALAKKKGKKKEPSIEIDIAGMWDDFEVDGYDDALSQASEELRRTEEFDAEEPDAQLGAERSSPPPVPGDKK